MTTEPKPPNGPASNGDRESAEKRPSESHVHIQPSLRSERSRRISRDLHQMEVRPGSLPGSQRVRIIRHSSEFKRQEKDYLVATPEAGQAHSGLAGFFTGLRRFLIGRPIASENEDEQRVNILLALALFSSDALSSVAYATEQILFVLTPAGLLYLGTSIPISAAIIALLFIVIFSYRQTIYAYPNGGGSYIVASDNLGTVPGLIAGASLLVDYILTVAVSVSAAIAQITSIPAVNFLHPFSAELSIAAVLIIMFGNLRGLRESGTIFALPTYLFILSLLSVIALGAFRFVTGNLPNLAPPEIAPTETFGILLILSAFANGCTALTGVEAISNSVPSFRRPEPRNAANTLLIMGVILAVLFFGITFLANAMNIAFTADETVISQISRTLLGESPLYVIVQGFTMLILILAANTSFTGFPRLASILARDRFLPHQFSFRGDRLAFSVGIIVLAIASCSIIFAFDAEVEKLIPLYAVGVFTAFTLSQSGMVRRWWRGRGSGWQRGIAINGLGAVVTAVVAVIFIVTKFVHGAWTVAILIPAMVALFLSIRRHYRSIADDLTLPSYDEALPRFPEPSVLVPIGRLDRATFHSLAFARSMSEDVTAVHVTDEREEAEEMRERWDRWAGDIPLVILESPYRSLVPPLTAYIQEIKKQDPERLVTIVLSEFVPRHWWEYLLHNQTAARLKFRLFFMPNVVVVDVPYHLSNVHKLSSRRNGAAPKKG